MNECEELQRFLVLAAELPELLVRPVPLAELAAMIPAIEQAMVTEQGAGVSAVLAGLWLRAGELDRGHAICQDLQTPLGSAWHAVMHRKEGDFSNSKYWWRQARLEWPADLGEKVRGVFPATSSGALARAAAGGRYDAAGFVDAVQAGYAGGGTWGAVLERVQQLEWIALMGMSLAACEEKR